MLGCVALKAPNMFTHRVQEQAVAAGLSEVQEGRDEGAREREILLTKRARALLGLVGAQQARPSARLHLRLARLAQSLRHPHYTSPVSLLLSGQKK